MGGNDHRRIGQQLLGVCGHGLIGLTDLGSSLVAVGHCGSAVGGVALDCGVGSILNGLVASIAF